MSMEWVMVPEKRQQDENATNSNNFTQDSVNQSNMNMNDLDAMRLQSADDVRTQSDQYRWMGASLKKYLSNTTYVNPEEKWSKEIVPTFRKLRTFVLKKCDDCRQSVKAVIVGKQLNEEAASMNTSEIYRRRNSGDGNKNVNQPFKRTRRYGSVDSNQTVQLPIRKRGRPPKAGPSKKCRKIMDIDEFYHGKLENLVKRCKSSQESIFLSDCDSDWYI